MKKNKNMIILLIILVITMSSCTVLSFYPLYTDDVLVTNNRIIGEWQTEIDYDMNKKDTLLWNITADSLGYKLLLNIKSAPKEEAQFNLFLVELAGETYIDFYPDEYDIYNPILSMSLMGMHSFAKISIKDTINITWMDYDNFTDKIENNEIRIKYERNEENILLTEQPEELQKFIIKYANDEDAFGDLNYKLSKIKK